MAINDKQLLLKDLCTRLPYNVKCEVIDRGIKVIGTLNGYTPLTDGSKLFGLSNKEYNAPDKYWQPKAQFSIEEIKPYLRPMSSMTEEERKEFNKLINLVEERCINGYGKGGYSLAFTEFNDWLNAHLFDYRCLIDKGLVLEAPKGMYTF